jgi:hypothetical protein
VVKGQARQIRWRSARPRTPLLGALNECVLFTMQATSRARQHYLGAVPRPRRRRAAPPADTPGDARPTLLRSGYGQGNTRCSSTSVRHVGRGMPQSARTFMRSRRISSRTRPKWRTHLRRRLLPSLASVFVERDL